MKKATFVFKNEYREDEETFEGESWAEIFEAFNEAQNIDCEEVFKSSPRLR